MGDDEQSAREWLESMRWPTGPVCVHCGGDEVDLPGAEQTGEWNPAGFMEMRVLPEAVYRYSGYDF